MFSSDLGEPELVANPKLEATSLSTSVPAGFPSPAADFCAKRIDVMEHLVVHPQATYTMRVSGESMRELGIFNGDVILVDKAVRPRHGMVVIAVVDGEFTCKQLHLRNGRMWLKAANPTFPDIKPKEGQVIEIWGVVIASIKVFPV
ncbi:translesion error-prone DNA polymerase V autoproteolytic subunit [Hydrogenophaga sp. 2FB]|uniref:LexA family protein n=1 Tax=Hydrogenophaga sp. 2FB TaxID=2502187 RepID=UPI003398686F